MPTINIYQSSKEFESKLKMAIPELKELVSKELSGISIHLEVNEISIRIIEILGDGMLSKVEVEINAAAFDDRVKKQDEICLNVQKYLVDVLNTDVKVWLILSELGHSWEEA